MGKMISEYEDMLASGEYESEEELCNDLELDHYDLYEDDSEDDE